MRGLLQKICSVWLALAITFTGLELAFGAAAKPQPSPTKNPYGATFPVPDPKPGDIVLTIKANKTLNFSMHDLIKLAVTDLTIHEPFVRQIQTFRVLKFQSLFKGLKVPAGAKLNTIALNDYVYLDSATNLFQNNAFLAVGRNGALIPMDQGGPIRLVFADASKYAKNLDAWNWSLRTVEVK